MAADAEKEQQDMIDRMNEIFKRDNHRLYNAVMSHGRIVVVCAAPQNDGNWTMYGIKYDIEDDKERCDDAVLGITKYRMENGLSI